MPKGSKGLPLMGWCFWDAFSWKNEHTDIMWHTNSKSKYAVVVRSFFFSACTIIHWRTTNVEDPHTFGTTNSILYGSWRKSSSPLEYGQIEVSSEREKEVNSLLSRQNLVRLSMEWNVLYCLCFYCFYRPVGIVDLKQPENIVVIINSVTGMVGSGPL